MIQSANTTSKSLEINVLTEDQIYEIRQAAFDIVESVGFKCRHPQVKKMMKQAGAIIDGDIIRIPKFIVQQALVTTPKGWTIYDRLGRRALELEGEKSHFGTSTGSPNHRDVFTGEIRPTTIRDIEMGALVADALEHIDFVMPMGTAQDVPAETAELYEIPAMLANTVKPSVFLCYSGKGCEYVYEMAALVAGGMDKLREKPFIIAYPEAIAPLHFPDEVVERLFIAADRFVPQLPGSTVQAGATGPVTMAGVVTQITAESLIHITIAQLRKPGCPVSMSGNVGILDMRTALMTMGAPENSLALIAQAEVAQSFNLPSWGLAGATDAKVLDAQAGIDATFSIFSQGLSKLNLIHDVGYMASGMACSLEQLVMGNDIIGMTKRFAEGIQVTKETLARQVIQDIGPTGHFLGHKHTMANFKKELSNPFVRNLESISGWQTSGKPTLEERVKEEIQKILDTHKPEPLSDKVLAEIIRLQKEGEIEIRKTLEQ